MTAATAQHDEWRIPKGSVIFRQGDPGHEMFVISSGRVSLTIGAEGHQKEVAVLGPGEFFGELSLLSDEPRSATAQTVEDSTLLAIGRDVFAMLVQDDLDIVFRMMNIQGRRLSQTNQPIQQLTQRLDRIRIAAHCLRRLLSPHSQLPATLDVIALGKELGLSPQAVEATVTDLVQRGVGTRRDQQWHVQSREEALKLLDQLCQYTDAGAR